MTNLIEQLTNNDNINNNKNNNDQQKQQEKTKQKQSMVNNWNQSGLITHAQWRYDVMLVRIRDGW